MYRGAKMSNKSWFRFENKAGEDSTTVYVYDEIGYWGVTAKEFCDALNGVATSVINLKINSPGGDVFDGMSLYNAFANHPGGVTVRIEGLAASMASIVAMGGRKVEAYQNTMFMIHNAWTVAGGDHNAMREIAEIIEKISGQMLEVYTGKTKTGKKDMKQMMDDETWMTAGEAEAKGFIDTVLNSGKGAKGQFDLSMFANVPEGIVEEQEGRELTRKETERALRNAGASREYARAVAAKRADASEAELIAACQKTLSIFGG